MTETKFSAIYNYRAVNDRLAASSQPTEDQLHDIAAAGYAVIINLALHDDPRYRTDLHYICSNVTTPHL